MLGTIALLTAGVAGPALAVADEAQWYADYDEAAAVAAKEGKDLLVEFTGSDWCHFCIKFHGEITQHEEFWKEAQEDFVLVALDFPRGAAAKKKVPNPKRNVELRDQHGVRGYPTVLLMTPEGDVYGQTGYREVGPEAYVDHLDDLRKKRPARELGVGSTVPASLALPDLDGEMHSFSDLRGKVVMVHFWSSTCPYEVHADPIFAAMEKRFSGSRDVVMIGINSNETELGKAPGKKTKRSRLYGDLRKKMAEVGYSHPMLADHGNVVADLFQAQSTPHCFVIDAKGVIRYAGALDDDPRGKKGDDATNYVSDAIDAVRMGKAPKVASTKPYGCAIKRAAKGDA